MLAKKILVGHDGSAHAEAALDYACHLAKKLGSEIVVLTVKHYIQHVAGYVDERMMARREEFYRRIEEAIRAQWKAAGGNGGGTPSRGPGRLCLRKAS